jgi:hypothetical protein
MPNIHRRLFGHTFEQRPLGRSPQTPSNFILLVGRYEFGHRTTVGGHHVTIPFAHTAKQARERSVGFRGGDRLIHFRNPKSKVEIFTTLVSNRREFKPHGTFGYYLKCGMTSWM